MSRFTTPLDVRKMARDASADKRGTWKLLAPLVYVSDLLEREITVPAGFITDFASVPRLPIAYLLAANCGHEAAVIHDWLYTTHLTTRRRSDAVFEEALAVGGEPAWRVWLMWAGVRIGGSGPYDAAGQRQLPHVAQAIDYAHPDGP
jgi:hypothetical protein